jgi:cytosine/adenosine deaminase-related metal-dependent hydrolase
MVAMKELTDRNIPLSLHSDFAMAPAEPLLLAWVAANRIVASGKVMNPEQRISVYNAMKGVTITAARTFEMDHEIGSIKKGKQATFTLLEQNPFKVDPVKIKDIPVVGVVYKGKMKLNKGKLIGGDRDAHGCIASAGYSWCERTNQCERPWELARKHNLENIREAFDKYCGNPYEVGST